ncbi:MAG: hypothetical protein AB9842_02510 [Bacteroidales bacterium]
MKSRLLVLLFLFSFSTASFSQEKPMAVSFEEFQSWMQTLTPLGYPFTETGKNGNEFLATFLKEKDLKMIGITISPLSTFEDYKKFKGSASYTYKQHRAVFYGTQNFWNLVVEVKDLDLCFQVTTVYVEATKEQLEKVVTESGVLTRKK